MIIAIEASAESSSFAVAMGDKIIGNFKIEISKISSSIFPGLMNDFLKAMGANIQQTEKIVVSIGPGSYTGLRISISLAKALSYSLNIPVIPINVLDVCLFQLNCLEDSKGKILVGTVDARRDEAYIKIEHNNTLLLDTSPYIFKEGSFSEYENETIWIAGDAAGKIKRIIKHQSIFTYDYFNPSAEAMLRMVINSKDIQLLQAEELWPLYIKEFQTNPSKNWFV